MAQRNAIVASFAHHRRTGIAPPEIKDCLAEDRH
jgi:hypothetical protein